MPAYHLFLSYSRRDNLAPVNAEGQGWVTAFAAELKRRHLEYSGRELEVFLDTESIEEGVDWRRRLGAGLRESRLFLAFLSPNYITSKNCLWEWEEYLRREHSSARGDDGLLPIYFVTPGDLSLREDQQLADWLRQMEEKYPWFTVAERQLTAQAERLARPFLADVRRRQRTQNLELHPWYESGPQVLRELDAAERSAAVKAAPRDPAADTRTLKERLEGLDRHIAQRLDRIALADLAPGNVPRSHEHFVGRHRELRELHDIMTEGGPQIGGRGMGGRGMIAAAFSPGGLGKTALARQYAHAYAEFYAAGGTWEIPCEGVEQIGAALLKLADSAEFQRACEMGFDVASQSMRLMTERLSLTEAERADYPRAAAAVLAYLSRVTLARVAVLRESLRSLPERHCPEHAPLVLGQERALLILDNVDCPGLLSALQMAQLPAEEWLEIIVTTRLNPQVFGLGPRSFQAVEVSVLPEADALRLLADFQPEHRFANEAEEAAARQIAEALGGYTLAVELVGAYLGARAAEGYQPSHYLPRLQQQGLTQVDLLAGETQVAGQIRHSAVVAENHIATLVAWSVDRLSAPARSALRYASLMMPDEIPLVWLKMMTKQKHPEALAAVEGAPDPWFAVWRELRGLRLLHPAQEVEVDDRGLEQIPQTVRLHRLVAQHVTAADEDGDGSYSVVEQFLASMATLFHRQVGKEQDGLLRDQHGWLRDQHGWLRDQLEHMISFTAVQAPTALILRSAAVAADFEGQHLSLVRALELTERILAAQEKLLAADADSADLARDVSVSLEKLGDYYRTRGAAGDGEKALACYERSLEIKEKLLAAIPGSGQAARDVSVSLIKLGDYYSARGGERDGVKALACYERSLKVSEMLLAVKPGSRQAARDASVSLEKLGNYFRAFGNEGDKEKVLVCYESSLKIREKLFELNNESEEAARDLSVSLEKLGDCCMELGDEGNLEKGLMCYERALELRRRFLVANPDSGMLARDMSVVLEKLGDSYRVRCGDGDGEKVLTCYVWALELRNMLLAVNPESGQAVRDVMVSLERLSIVASGQPGGEKEALDFQIRALEMALKLRERNPGNGFYERTAAVSAYLTIQRAESAGDLVLSEQAMTLCFTILDGQVKRGAELDTAMRWLYDYLRPHFQPQE